MGQVLQKDKIGNLTESGGTITLAPSVLTIGGQQYSTGQLQVTPSGLISSSLYRVYAVLNGGAVNLVVSQNNNSIGPTGYLAWKLVGHFYTNFNNSIVGVSSATEDGFARLKPVYFRADSFSDAIPNSVNTTVTLSNIVSDDYLSYDPSVKGLRILRSGSYSVNCKLRYNAFSAVSTLHAYLAIDGSSIVRDDTVTNTTNTNWSVSLSFNINVLSGQYISIVAFQNSGATRTLLGTSLDTFVSIQENLEQPLIKDEDL